ncbi:hypothetical protein [Streptomyces cadmiisoli]|uniref:hypothetical protein n=1 Tax=Streptomyces cadmiisoli TaxID=2184053 RepID=UPI0018EF5317|nr:hypothetical protein [Streptomyces cadmiisoli]
MPSFHRPPDWQQPADRHTRLTDPVLTVRQLSRFELSLKHVVRIDHALVFSTPKGGYESYLPPRRPSRGEIAAHRYTAVYEVDTGVHPFTDTLALPSDNDAFEFTAEVDVSWRVHDPARFVASGVRDVPALLLGELQQTARPVARRFSIADSAAAEQELLRTLAGPLGASAGLHVDRTLRLRRDQANIDHQHRLQEIDHSAAEQIRVARQGMRVDVETDHRDRQQDALQLGRAMDYGRQQQELTLQQQRWQHEQAMLQGQQMLELQKIEAQKIEFYQWHLSQGGVQSWALHLAQHPEDSRVVMQSLREDQLRMIQAQMDLVKELLGGEGAEKFELEGPKQLALRTVSDILNQRLPGVPQTPPLLPAPDQGHVDGGGGPAPYDASARPYDASTPAPAPPAPPITGPYPAGPYPPGPHPDGPYPAGPYPTATPYAPPPAGVPHPAPPAGPASPPPPHATAPNAPGTPYAPPPMPYAPPPVPPGAPVIQAAPVTPPPPAAYPPPRPAAPAWQPPPGYGTSPTAPADQASATPTPPPDRAPATPPTTPGPAAGTDRADPARADGTEDEVSRP